MTPPVSDQQNLATPEAPMTPNDMTAALTREPTTEERHQHQLGFASYQAWTAGVAWAAEHGHGDWDDAEQAWATWWETTAPAPKF